MWVRPAGVVFDDDAEVVEEEAEVREVVETGGAALLPEAPAVPRQVIVEVTDLGWDRWRSMWRSEYVFCRARSRAGGEPMLLCASC